MRARTWTVLLLVTVFTSDTGVSGRALSRRTPREYDLQKRWKRGLADAHRDPQRDAHRDADPHRDAGAHRDALRDAGAHRDAQRARCADLSAPWTERTDAALGDALLLPLRLRPFSPGASHGSIFPGKSLFSFVRRVYQCCQQRVHCRSVKGIQGRLREADVEFLLLKEISSLTVTRAELHLQLSNPQHVPLRPMLSSLAKLNLPTRYSSSTRGDVTEIRVDLHFLIKHLQDVAGGIPSSGLSLVNIRRTEPPPEDSGPVWDGPPRGLDLGLVLDCGESCTFDEVHILHAPFIALYYK